MARPKGFETEEALRKAMHLFLQKGYEAASMQEMVACTGLSCSSLYNSFGDKHALFLATLEFYIAEEWKAMDDLFAQPIPRLQVVRAMLQNTVHAISEGGEIPCLVVDAAIELGHRDEEVSRAVQAQLLRTEYAFTQLFAEAQRNGEIRPERDPKALARFLANVIMGLRVSGKANQEQQSLQDVVDTAMEALS